MASQKSCLIFLVFLFGLNLCHGMSVQCEEGEVWRGGITPEPCCDNLFPAIDYFSFKHGCYCKEDFVRNAEGKCIRITECPQFLEADCSAIDGILVPEKCPAGEVWREGIDPEPTCSNLFPSSVSFREGCFCDDDYVRDDSGKCIMINECPQFADWLKKEEEIQESFGELCIPGETFRIDCNICTCSPEGIPICTTRDCNAPGSDDDDDLPPNGCRPGEIWREGFFPQPSCDDLFPPIDYYETRNACFCKDDYVRNREGECVLVSQCPQYSWPMEVKGGDNLEWLQTDEDYLSAGGHLKRRNSVSDVDLDERINGVNRDPLNLMQSLFSNLKKERNECTVYGDFVGLKLNKFNDNPKNILMNIINNAIYHADVGHYDQPATVDNPGYNFLSVFHEPCSTAAQASAQAASFAQAS